MTPLHDLKKRTIPLSLIFAFAFMGLAVANVLYLGIRQAEDISKWREASIIERNLKTISDSVWDAETAERSFLASKQEADRAHFDESAAGISRNLDELKKKLAGRNNELGLLSNFEDLTGQKLAELKAVIRLKKAGEDHAAEDLAQANRNNVLVYRMGGVMRQLAGAEDQRVEERRAETQAISRKLLISIILTSLLFLIAALTGYLSHQKQLTQLRKASADLQAVNLKLIEEAKERERVAEQLRHSQKLEALGQLTGGIAHDFNNMLTIIVSSFSLIKRRLASGDTADIIRFIESGIEGAERASALTSRLLAFARRQSLSPVPIDPNKFIIGLVELLRRTIGETIEIETMLAEGAWLTHADKHQLENILINLCLNARDAMPEGGKLTLSTGNTHLDEDYAASQFEVASGQYVKISVADTGCGMPPEVAAKAFDPFFTTKPVGKGTGLGLSQVFGFVKQSGGHVKILSEPGQGTKVELYLPRFSNFAEEEIKPPWSEARINVKSCETILLVEDEETVRELSRTLLNDLGYEVHEAAGPIQALQILDSNPGIRILFTDIVMPVMNGRKLAEEALRRKPDLKILFTTGYTQDAIVHNGVLDPGVQLLSKPYNAGQLAAKLREVLDAV